MAERQFTCPIPRPAQVPASMSKATETMERVALKWRDLAERRREHLIELYQSGRWQRYYTEDEFLIEVRAADAMVKRWAKIAPKNAPRVAPKVIHKRPFKPAPNSAPLPEAKQAPPVPRKVA